MAWYPGKNIEKLLDRRRRRDEEAETAIPEVGKEDYYLKFNKDEIFKNLIAIEGHFRNVMEQHETVEKGFMNCCVKHAADAEGHADEAISHSAIIEGEEKSRSFRDLRNGIKGLRWNLQKDAITPFDGIKAVRQLRRQFASFNPEYDISKCKSCEPVEALMEKALEQQRKCVPDDSPGG